MTGRQPREHAVPCVTCRKPTWNTSARCDDHQEKPVATKKPAVQPAMCCHRCGGMDLVRTARSDGKLGSDRRVPGRKCTGCGAWWAIVVGRAS